MNLARIDRDHAELPINPRFSAERLPNSDCCSREKTIGLAQAGDEVHSTGVEKESVSLAQCWHLDFDNLIVQAS